MSFGLNKCAILTIVNGKPVEATILDDFPWLPHDEGYKYLGILESSDFHMKKIKITATKEYISQVRKILKAQLSAHNTMMAICTYAVPVMRYTFGIIKWNKGELLKLDQKTCKLLTTHGLHHAQADVNCLYLHQAEGGCGLAGVWDTYAHECAALMQYIQESDDPLTSMIPTTSTPIINHLNQFNQGQQCHTLE